MCQSLYPSKLVEAQLNIANSRSMRTGAIGGPESEIFTKFRVDDGETLAHSTATSIYL